MGYSCTKDASNMLGVIGKMFATNGNPNILTIRGREYFFERGREQRDGAITGILMVTVDSNGAPLKIVSVPSVLEQKLFGAQVQTQSYCRKAGTVRIEPDGKITRFPALNRDEKREAENTFRDMSARNPQLLSAWACGRI